MGASSRPPLKKKIALFFPYTVIPSVRRLQKRSWKYCSVRSCGSFFSSSVSISRIASGDAGQMGWRELEGQGISGGGEEAHAASQGATFPGSLLETPDRWDCGELEGQGNLRPARRHLKRLSCGYGGPQRHLMQIICQPDQLSKRELHKRRRGCMECQAAKLYDWSARLDQ